MEKKSNNYGVEYMCFRVSYVRQGMPAMCIQGVEYMCFRVSYVKVRGTPYNFRVIRGFSCSKRIHSFPHFSFRTYFSEKKRRTKKNDKN